MVYIVDQTQSVWAVFESNAEADEFISLVKVSMSIQWGDKRPFMLRKADIEEVLKLSKKGLAQVKADIAKATLRVI